MRAAWCAAQLNLSPAWSSSIRVLRQDRGTRLPRPSSAKPSSEHVLSNAALSIPFRRRNTNTAMRSVPPVMEHSCLCLVEICECVLSLYLCQSSGAMLNVGIVNQRLQSARISCLGSVMSRNASNTDVERTERLWRTLHWKEPGGLVFFCTQEEEWSVRSPV